VVADEKSSVTLAGGIGTRREPFLDTFGAFDPFFFFVSIVGDTVPFGALVCFGAFVSTGAFGDLVPLVARPRGMEDDEEESPVSEEKEDEMDIAVCNAMRKVAAFA
jgi:hypothetical protein